MASSENQLTIHFMHDAPEYLEQTAALISEEWPRGMNARLLSLKNSNPDLPCNIIVVADQATVVAHCRLCSVNDEPSGLLIETVVVSKARRGQGLGKRIMMEAEAATIRYGKSTLYLSTHDKQEFYRHLGFEECAPVTSLGGNGAKLSATQLQGLLGAFGGKQAQPNDGRTWMKKNLSNGT